MASWRKQTPDGDIKNQLNKVLPIYFSITGDFWREFWPRLIHNWDGAFGHLSIISIDILNNEVETFVRTARKAIIHE